MKLYIVKTGNMFNEVLAFTSRKAAISWIETATIFKGEEAQKMVTVLKRQNLAMDMKDRPFSIIP